MNEDKNGHAQTQPPTELEQHWADIDRFMANYKSDTHFSVDVVKDLLNMYRLRLAAARPAEQPAPPPPLPTKMTPVVREMSDIFNMVEGKRCCPKHIGCELHARAEQTSAPPQPAHRIETYSLPQQVCGWLMREIPSSFKLAEILKLMNEYTEAEKSALTQERDALRRAIRWALGEEDDFAARPEGAPAYWWRTELRARAAAEESQPK